MLCLKCWKEIHDKVAIYTKPCKHIFCKSCGEKAFNEQLSCPHCNNVLPKDGITHITIRPDEVDLNKVAARTFGFDPSHMCQILQLSLDFWATQNNNNSLKHVNDVNIFKEKLQDAEKQQSKLIKTLEEERMKKNTVQQENEKLKRTLSDLEAKYTEKTDALRKLKDLYNDLRQVHKRLETDLQGVRDEKYDNFDKDLLDLHKKKPKSAIIAETIHTNGPERHQGQTQNNLTAQEYPLDYDLNQDRVRTHARQEQWQRISPNSKHVHRLELDDRRGMEHGTQDAHRNAVEAPGRATTIETTSRRFGHETQHQHNSSHYNDNINIAEQNSSLLPRGTNLHGALEAVTRRDRHLEDDQRNDKDDHDHDNEVRPDRSTRYREFASRHQNVLSTSTRKLLHRASDDVFEFAGRDVNRSPHHSRPRSSRRGEKRNKEPNRHLDYTDTEFRLSRPSQGDR